MEPRDVDFLLRAKRQLRLTRLFTVIAAALSVVALAAVVVLPGYRVLAQCVLYWTLLGAFLVNSDLGGSALISRRDLIAALEAQLNRDAAALRYERTI